MINSIVYIGNKSSQWGKTPTTIETLGVRLAEDYTVNSYSSYQYQIFRLFHMIFGILRNAKKNPIVIIDTYSTKAFYYSFICAYISQKLGLKHIVYVHGGDFRNRIRKSPQMCNRLFGSASKVICPSGFLYEVVSQSCPKANVGVIFNSIPLEDYQFVERDHESINIFWLRSFHRIYNPNMAVDVLLNLKKLGVEGKLTMVGPDKDSSMSKFLRYAESKGLNTSVTVTGGLSFPEWTKKSKTQSYFINTANFDNMPVSVIEAMALGIPVVSTNVGGVPFIIEDGVNGFMVRKNDAEQMARNIHELSLNRDLYQSISTQARITADKFAWSNVKDSWKALFEELTGV